MGSLKQIVRFLPVAFFLVFTGPVLAVSPKERGVKMGTTVVLAASLATCRSVRGDGNDWLDYYFQRLKADRKAIASFMSLPNKIAAQRAQEVIGYFGSCTALLEYENENGIKAFIDEVIPELSRKICENAGGC